MRKKILALLLVAATTLGLVACNGGGASDASKYPTKTVKIGVELYDPTEVETLAMQAYFDELKKDGLNVEFIYSEAIKAPEQETKFIDDCYNAGCIGIIGYYNVAPEETVQRCVDYGMYYWGSALAYEDVMAKFIDNPYVLDNVSHGSNGDYDAGFVIGQYFANSGAKKIIYSSGGAEFGVPLFVDRKAGFEDAIKDADIEVINVAGFPGDAFFAAQASALAEDIDGVAASFNGLDYWVQPIATAGKTDSVPVATVGSITPDYAAAIQNGSINLLVSGNIQRYAIGVFLILNANEGNAEALQVDGKAGTYDMPYWVIDSPEEAEIYGELASGTNEYRMQDLMTLIVSKNPDANADTLKELVAAAESAETIKAMHEANDQK